MTLQELSPCKQTSIKNCSHSIFFFNSYALTFCTRSQITWRYFSQFSIIFIAQFCSCYTESHLSFICPSSWTTNQAKLWGYLWPCDLLALTPFSHITQKTLSFLYSTEVKQITKTTVIFKTEVIFVCCVGCNPISPRTSVQRLAHTRNVTTCSSRVQGGLGNSGSASAQGGIGKFWILVVERLPLDSILQNLFYSSTLFSKSNVPWIILEKKKKEIECGTSGIWTRGPRNRNPSPILPLHSGFRECMLSFRWRQT